MATPSGNVDPNPYPSEAEQAAAMVTPELTWSEATALLGKGASLYLPIARAKLRAAIEKRNERLFRGD